MNLRLLLLLPLSCATAFSAPRTSANFTIAAESTGVIGGRAISANYTNDSAADPVSGRATSPALAVTIKLGYVSQLFEIAGTVINAASPDFAEDAAFQLGAWQLLDDASFLSVPAGLVAWSVVAGPIVEISAVGLAMADAVYQDTAASVNGTFAGFTGFLELTVVNSLADNFGAYAGDLLDDDWQVLHFGPPPNALAGPLVDADGDGFDNRFEFLAKLVPVDATSRFVFTIAPVPDLANPGQFLAGQQNLTFSPHFADRIYIVQATDDLTIPGSWSEIAGSAPSDQGDERTITDLEASGSVKFYRIEITRP